VRSQTALERRVANLEKMIRVSRVLRSAFDLPTLLQQIIDTIVEFANCELLVLLEEWLGYQNCAVLMYDKDRDCLTVTAYRGSHSRAIQNCAIPVNENSLSGRVATSLRASRIGALRAEPNLRPLLEDTRSALSVPLLCGEDVDLVGVISLESPDRDAFTEGDVRILSTIGAQSAIAIRQAELYEASRRANQLKQEFITTMSHEMPSLNASAAGG